jgi:hypothetical protein
MMAVVAMLITLVSADVLAQRQGGQPNRGSQVVRQQQVQRDRAMDRDRMAQRSQQVERSAPAGAQTKKGQATQGQNRKGEKEGSYGAGGDGDQLQQRDQLREQDRVHQTTEAADGSAMYGSGIMTEQERNRYQERLQLAGTDAEKAQLKAEHQTMMQNRAKQLGVDLPEPAQGKGAAAQAQEQNRNRSEIGNPDQGELMRSRSEEQVQQRLDDPGIQPDAESE